MNGKIKEGNPQNCYYYCEKNGANKDLEQIISTNARYSYCYALNVIKCRFELGEKAISTYADYKKEYYDFLSSIEQEE